MGLALKTNMEIVRDLREFGMISNDIADELGTIYAIMDSPGGDGQVWFEDDSGLCYTLDELWQCYLQNIEPDPLELCFDIEADELHLDELWLEE